MTNQTNDAVSVTINGLMMESISKTGVKTEFGYDALERRCSSRSVSGTSGEGLIASYTHFNSLGQVDYVEDAATNRTYFAYDSETGRRIATTNALGKVTYTEYSPEGQTMGVWGATYPVLYDYDDYDRMIAMYTLRSTNVVASDYSGFRSQVASFDKTMWLYDETTGLLTNKLYADTNGVAYTYYSDGKLATRAWARGITTTYSYTNTTGEMIGIDYSDSTPDISYTYTRIGLQDTITDAQGTRTFAYNNKLQRVSETIVANGVTNVITRSYDSLGRGDGFSLNDGYDVDYGFDNKGRFISVQSVINDSTNLFSYSYLPNSDLIAGVSNSMPSALCSLRTYEDNRNLITEIKNVFGTNVISQYNYLNDELGRRVERLDQIIDFAATQTNDFSYNDRSEVIAAVMGTNEFGYLFDNIGNRNSSTNNGVSTDYIANNLNQYTEVIEAVTNVPVYDLDGNMTSFNGWTFTWNGENRMIKATNATKVVECKYDYVGRRFSKTVDGAEITFIYNGWNMIQESSATETNHYVWGLDLSASMQGAGGVGGLLSVTEDDGSVYFACADGNGNITGYVNDSGNAQAAYSYNPFGGIIESSGTKKDDFKYRFSSKYWDSETDLIYYGYRYLNVELGRWINKDPIEENGGVLLYGFMWNNAISRIDNLGLTASADEMDDIFDEAFRAAREMMHSPYYTYSNPDAAAAAAGAAWLPDTLNDPDYLEHCGLVCKHCDEYMTTHILGYLDDNGFQNCRPHDRPCPSGWTMVAWWHTHAYNRPWWRFWESLEDNWSPADRNYSDRRQLPGYLTNEDGSLRYNPDPDPTDDHPAFEQDGIQYPAGANNTQGSFEEL